MNLRLSNQLQRISSIFIAQVDLVQSQPQELIFHIRVLYPTDMRASSQSMFGMLNGFTLDPGISDQFTDISCIEIPNHLQRKTSSTSKHHLHDIVVHGQSHKISKRFTRIVNKWLRDIKKKRCKNENVKNYKWQIDNFYPKLSICMEWWNDETSII